MSTSRSPGKPLVEAHERVDPFLGGRIEVIQSRSGYRFSVDALLLSGFAGVKEGDRVADLGTGCGIIPLLLLCSRGAGAVVGLEIQEGLAGQASRNALLNGAGNRMFVVLGDLRRPPLKSGSFDLVVSNPPYRKAESGRINPDRERAIARHEIRARLGDVVRAARVLLKAKGRLAVIYPAERSVDLLVRMRASDLEPKRLQFVYPGRGGGAKLVLVEGVLGGRPGLKVLPSIVDQGEYGLRQAH
jgi:tRNA1Val (adenine37-N6)-methyltransferase